MSLSFKKSEAVRDKLKEVWHFARPFAWPAATGLLALAFVIAVVRPFDPLDTMHDQMTVAQAWNNSMARLGIEPVYPPQEDLHVGDLFAVIADGEEKSLLGRSVRVAHIDLRELIQAEQIGRPIFAETSDVKADLKPGSVARRQDFLEADTAPSINKKISLTLAAFPGITIRYSGRSTGALSAWQNGSSAGRDDAECPFENAHG